MRYCLGDPFSSWPACDAISLFSFPLSPRSDRATNLRLRKEEKGWGIRGQVTYPALLSLVTGRGKGSLHPKREEQKCHEVGGGEKNVQQCAAQFFLVFPHIFREKNKMSWKRRETLEHPTDQVSSPIFFSRRVASKKSFVTTVAALFEEEGEYSKGSKSEGRSLKRLHRFQSDPRSTLPLHPSSPMESFPLS